MTATTETLEMHIKDFSAHAARFEHEANEIAREIETTLDNPHTYRVMRSLVPKRQKVIYLRHLADGALAQVAYCQKQLAEKSHESPDPTHD
jgi:plasmid stabilization system protein ParE